MAAPKRKPRDTELRENEVGYRSIPKGGKALEGMELVGMRGGNQIYAPMGEVYGKEPGSGSKPNPNATASGSNRIIAPVVKTRTSEDIRAEYQQRNQPKTAEEQAARNRTTETTTRVGFNNFQAPPPQRNMDQFRGPASQRETVTPTPNRSVTPPPSQNQSASVARYEAALNDYQSGLSKSGGNADDDRARFGKLQQIYNDADEMSRIGMSNATMRRASGVNQTNAAASPYGGQAPRVGGQGSTVGSKVVGIRPATDVTPQRKSKILKRKR